MIDGDIDWNDLFSLNGDPLLAREHAYPQLTELEYHTMLDIGFYTGSRVLGGFTDTSDYDYVMLEQDYIDNNFIYPYTPYDDLFGTSSIKVSYNSMIVNILVTQQQTQLDSWKFATKTYLELCEKLKGNTQNINKEMRVKLFECLRELYLITH